MNKIGNILYTDELVNHKKVNYINYIENNNINIINNDLPTLIVGWNNVKFNNINNISILNKTIIPYKLYWEFSFKENKQEHVYGVDLFSKLSLNYFFEKKYNYITIDPIFQNILLVNDIFNYIVGDIKKTYLNNNMLYVLTTKNNIYGLNLNILDFFNIKKEKIILEFSEKSIIFVKDNDNDILNKYLKYFNGFEYTKRYLVIFL